MKTLIEKLVSFKKESLKEKFDEMAANTAAYNDELIDSILIEAFHNLRVVGINRWNLARVLLEKRGYDLGSVQSAFASDELLTPGWN